MEKNSGGKRIFNTAEQAMTASLWANLILMLTKLLSGHFGHSDAVFADGLESATDLLAVAAGMAALKIGSKPFDSDHPYGHGKAESIASLFVSLVIFATGGGILYGAIITIIGKDYGRPEMIAVLTAVFTIASKELLFRYTSRIATKTESPTLKAIAVDHRKDAITSIATLIGVGGAYSGWPLLDPVAAGITSLFIFYIGWQTFQTAANELMDRRPPQSLIDSMTKEAASVPGVDYVHEIRVRRSGRHLIVDLKIDMNPMMTVRKSHAIGDQVKKRILAHFPSVGDIMIHIHPSAEEHGEVNRL